MGYNSQITIQQETETRTDYGDVSSSWSTYKTVWADKDNTGGSVTHESDQPVYSESTTFKFRTEDADAVTTKMRISHDSQVYWIRSIQKDRLFTTLITEAYDDE